MAHSAEQWQRAKDLFESGQFSLSEISNKVGISKSKISEKSKKELWERGRNSDYIEAKHTLATKKGTEREQTIQLLDDIAEEQIRHKRLINSNAELLASKIPKMIEAMTLKEKDNNTGKIIEILTITPSDLKTLADTNDRLAITLKVADRHAPKIELTNTNAQQTNISIEDISKAIADGLPD